MPGDPDPRPVRRPQARGRERRESIIDAAVRLFSQRGFRGTGIAGLAQEVGISHVGVLHHFGTKRRLLEEVVAERDRMQARLIEHLAGLRGLEAIRALRLVAQDAAADELHVRLFIVLIAENLEPDEPLHGYFRDRYQLVRSYVAGAVRSGQQDGEIRPDVDPEAIGLEVMSLLAGTNLQWLLDPEAVDVVATIDGYLQRLIAEIAVGTVS